MSILKWVLILTAASFLVISLACSSGDSVDDDSPNGPSTEDPPEFLSIRAIDIPDAMRQSDDTKARLISGYIDEINSYGEHLIEPDFSRKLSAFTAVYNDGQPDWIDTVVIGQLTVIIEIYDDPDFYAWNWFYDGYDGQLNYTNWQAMHAEVHKTMGFGNFIIYDPASSGISRQWNFGYLDQGVYNMDLSDYSGGQRFDARENPDGSGRLEYYLQDGQDFVLQLRAEWQADGSGSWWEYDNDVQTGSGNW